MATRVGCGRSRDFRIRPHEDVLTGALVFASFFKSNWQESKGMSGPGNAASADCPARVRAVRIQ